MARAARSWEVVNSIYVVFECSRIVAPHHFFVSVLAMFTNNGKKAESVEMKRARMKKKKMKFHDDINATQQCEVIFLHLVITTIKIPTDEVSSEPSRPC